MKYLLVLGVMLLGQVGQASTQHPNVCYVDHASTAFFNTASNLASSASGNRKCMVIQNRNAAGGSSIYVMFNQAHTATEGIEITAGTAWEPNFVPSNNIYIKAFGGVVSATIVTGKGIP